MKGDPGLNGAVADRVSGSSDLYQWSGHLPVNSVNFIVAHDGFTLNDLVSYAEKHNWVNGENNNDGLNENSSWNCGVEGQTDDPAIEALRDRQIKNFASILMLSQGVPMMVMGDEVRRTQRGNNNAYCQDNDISWFNWDLVEEHKDMLRFWQGIIAFRRRHPTLHRSRFFTGTVNDRGLADLTWHGTKLYSPGWEDPNARSLAYTLGGVGDEADIHVIMNMYWATLGFAIPPSQGRKWYRVIDTNRITPEDIARPGEEAEISTDEYLAGGRSVAVLIAK